MSHATAARLQVVLEGVPLPAQKQELLSYARRQDADARELAALESLPSRQYRSLDDVGEELESVQPSRGKPQPHEPDEESGRPPGGDDYTRVPDDTGQVRDLEAAKS